MHPGWCCVRDQLDGLVSDWWFDILQCCAAPILDLCNYTWGVSWSCTCCCVNARIEVPVTRTACFAEHLRHAAVLSNFLRICHQILSKVVNCYLLQVAEELAAVVLLLKLGMRDAARGPGA